MKGDNETATPPLPSLCPLCPLCPALPYEEHWTPPYPRPSSRCFALDRGPDEARPAMRDARC